MELTEQVKHLYNCLKEWDYLNDQEEGDILYGSSKEDEIPIYKHL